VVVEAHYARELSIAQLEKRDVGWWLGNDELGSFGFLKIFRSDLAGFSRS
jgi:hypothetical protein